MEGEGLKTCFLLYVVKLLMETNRKSYFFFFGGVYSLLKICHKQNYKYLECAIVIREGFEVFVDNFCVYFLFFIFWF